MLSPYPYHICHNYDKKFLFIAHLNSFRKSIIRVNMRNRNAFFSIEFKLLTYYFEWLIGNHTYNSPVKILLISNDKDSTIVVHLPYPNISYVIRSNPATYRSKVAKGC